MFRSFNMTTTTTTSSSNKYPHDFLVIQVILGIITFVVLIALIFIIWYRFFKKHDIIVNRHSPDLEVDRIPNPIYQESSV